MSYRERRGREVAGGTVLVIDDEVRMGEFLRTILTEEGHRVEVCHEGATALRRITETRFDLIITDLMMPGIDGLKILDGAREEDPEAMVVVITGYSTVETAVEAMKRGAYDYLAKPFKMDEIKIVAQRAIDQRRVLSSNRLLNREIQATRDEAAGLIGKSPLMNDLLTMIDKVSRTDSTVLIRGESGTGKELVARAIHARSGRRDRPFVAVNCAALPETLLESELFGHSRGAFTGAVTSKTGLFEEADGGTILLDEIGDVSPVLQAKLLRVLQEGEFFRVGETRPRKVDVRVLAATNRDLERAMADGVFRPDLFYRLNIISLHVPPLRDRSEDIPLLAAHFLDRLSRKCGKRVSRISSEALQMLMKHQWPGNVRELENVIERGVILADTEEITTAELPVELSQEKSRDRQGPENLPLDEAVRRFEKEMILKALREAGGVQARAAEVLGIKRTTLNEKIKRLGLQWDKCDP